MLRQKTQQLYARAYDRCAARLYRFALYVLGDPRQAEAAVAEAFSAGLRAGFSPEKDTFLEGMLALVWRACEGFVPLEGPAYRERLRQAAPQAVTAPLAGALASMHREKRAALALAALFGFDAAALKRILPGCQPGRIAAAAVSLLRNPA